MMAAEEKDCCVQIRGNANDVSFDDDGGDVVGIEHVRALIFASVAHVNRVLADRLTESV